jgi:hypothetical protein
MDLVQARLARGDAAGAREAMAQVAEPAQGEPESYVNQLGTPFVRVALVALGKATAVWDALAASRGSAVDVSDGPRGGPRGPKLTASEQNTPVEEIVLKARHRDHNPKKTSLNQAYKMRTACAYGLERFWGEHLRGCLA